MATPADKSYLAELNAQQRAATTFGDGALLIIAGAGTGKTKTLVSRLAYLIDSGVSPDAILLLTFTRRAAAEMLSRATHLCEPGATGKVWGGTFHAIANRLLRTYGRPAGITSDFTVMDQADAADMMNLIRSDLGLNKKGKRFPKKETLLKAYSMTVNAQTKLTEIVDKHFPWCKKSQDGMKEVFGSYVKRKREHNVLDYDDLLLFWRSLCETEGVGPQVADRFEHILVDEYQDTNAIQAQILLGMRQAYKNITVVGDDAQSIYSFRAATIRNILDFSQQFAGAKVITLEQNYRSTIPILDASNAVMEYAKERYTKELWSQRKSEQKPVLMTCVDESDQSRAVCEAIIEHLEMGTPLSSQAVLFRAGHHSAALEIELAKRNIPFHKYGGLKFVEAAHIKDMLAFLRVLENPYDQISWFRVLQLLEGIGPKSAQRLMSELGVRRNLSLREEIVSPESGEEIEVSSPLKCLFDDPPAAPAAAKEQYSNLRQALADCQGVILPKRRKESNSTGSETNVSADGEPTSSITDRLDLPAQLDRLRAFYEPIFEEVYSNAFVRVRDIEQLQEIAGKYKSRQKFITDLTLDPPVSTSDLAGPSLSEEDFLVLSTIHSAKGCEWDVVHVIHVADGDIPLDMSLGDDEGLEEERRLFYVSLTRAKNTLYIYFPFRHYHRGRSMSDGHSYVQLTRFLPEEMRHLFAVECSPDMVEDDSLAGDSATIDRVDERLNKLWE